MLPASVVAPLLARRNNARASAAQLAYPMAVVPGPRRGQARTTHRAPRKAACNSLEKEDCLSDAGSRNVAKGFVGN